MALFAKKKQKDLPDFSSLTNEEPTLMNKELEFPKFPTPPQYQQQQRPIPEFKPQEPRQLPKQEYKPYPEPEFDIPQRKKIYTRPQPIQESPYREEEQPEYKQPTPELRDTITHVRINKPLFIKVEHYREAVETLDKIKERLRESTQLLEELKQIREEEDRELEAWKQDMERIKNKLLEIDKLLFEENG